MGGNYTFGSSTVQLLGALKNVAKVCHVFPPPCQPVGDVVIVSRSDRQAVVVHNCQAIRDAWLTYDSGFPSHGIVWGTLESRDIKMGLSAAIISFYMAGLRSLFLFIRTSAKWLLREEATLPWPRWCPRSSFFFFFFSNCSCPCFRIAFSFLSINFITGIWPRMASRRYTTKCSPASSACGLCTFWFSSH